VSVQSKQEYTPSIEDRLIQYRKTNDKAVRDSIAADGAYMAEILAKRYSGRGIEYDDLYQVASIGLLYAIDRYDPSFNTKFSTYATQTILGEIKKHFRDTGHFIRIPRKMYEAFKREESTNKAKPYSLLSLEHDLNEHQNSMLENIIGKTDDGFLLAEDKNFIYQCLQSLTGEEHTFVTARYYEELTQQQVADKMHVSQMYISRLEKKVLNKIRDFYFKD